MALIKCNECGKEISDKAAACPGCGCPVKQPSDYSRYGKEELWQKAYNIQYKQSKDNLPEAIDIYRHIIGKYRDSDEASYARTQLEILNKTGQKCKPIKFTYKGKTFTEETLRLTDIYEVSSIGESLENSHQYEDALMLYKYALSYYSDCPQKRTIQDRITKLLTQVPSKSSPDQQYQQTDGKTLSTNQDTSIGVHACEPSSNKSNPSSNAKSSGFPYMSVVSVLIIIVIAIICSKLFDSRGIENYGSDMYAMREDAENSARLVHKLIYVLLALLGVWLGFGIKKMIRMRN